MTQLKFYHIRYRFLSIVFLLVFSVNLIPPVHAQENSHNDLKILSPNEFGQWEQISRGSSFSKDGKWLQYQTVTNNEDKTIFLTNTATKKTQEIKNAEGSVFSANSKWFAYSKALTGKESKKLKKKKEKKKKIPNKMGVINLSTKDSLEFTDVVNYKFSGSGAYLAMKREKEKVNTLIVKNLETGIEVTFGNIKEYSWQDKGTLLALLINTMDTIGNAIQLYNPVSGNLKVLDQKKEIYTGLKWRKKSDDLLVLRTSKDTIYKDDSYHLLFWKGLNSQTTLSVFDQNNHTNFPKNIKIKSKGISMSEDGSIVFFRTDFREGEPKNIEKSEEKNTKDVADEDEAADVEIWNSKDVDIIPAQKKNTRFGTRLTAWNVRTNTFYELENDLVDRLSLQTETNISIGEDQTPYNFEVMFGRPSYDLYSINTHTGSRKKLVTKSNRYWSVSPNDQFFVYLSADNLHLFDINKIQSSNITKSINDDFIDTENDHPTPQKPAFGFVGWSTDSKSFYINAKYDIWQVFTDGNLPKKITNGKADRIVYRYQNFDRDQKHIDLTKPVYFRMFGERSKKSGLAVLATRNEIKTLIYREARVSDFTKAKLSEELAYLTQTYLQTPNLFLTNMAFKSSKQISNTNAFQKDFAWGKAELITYTNVLGKEAQGILYYPANYKKGRKYPMITYIYEKLSNRFHNYIAPSRTSYYNTTVWLQNDYFVLNPDIEFVPGDPGISSARNLEQAVKAVVEKGDVDAKRVGLIGHSWGGYQAGYVPTQTDIFAASVAGAGLTEFISMNLAVTPAFGGTPENAHFEVSQERMQVAPWKAPKSYLRNSSVMHIEKLNTPILFEVGDKDENVNWFQGIAYYNAARRAGKDFVLLVYANEGHGLKADKNRIDYQQRILTWFGHYLKGEKAEDWMTNGVSYAEQQRRLKAK